MSLIVKLLQDDYNIICTAATTAFADFRMQVMAVSVQDNGGESVSFLFFFFSFDSVEITGKL